MLPTSFDLSQLHREHEQILAKWDARFCKGEIGKTHPRFAAVAPTLAVVYFQVCRWLRGKVLPLVYGIWSEVRGIAPRIRFQHAPNTNLDMCRAQTYQVDANGRRVPDTRTRTRIRDMQALAANHSWFGASDQWVHLQAWEAGARWAEDMPHLCSSRKES